MRTLILIAAMLTACPLTSMAQDSACADTFAQRLQTVRAQIKEWAREAAAQAAWERSPQGKAVAFFSQHCRFLSPLEIAIRKLDDPMSFVCDPSAGPKPKALTTKVLAESGNTGLVLQGSGIENHACKTQDPVDLGVNSDMSDPLNLVKITLVICHGDDRQDCLDARRTAQADIEMFSRQK